MGNEKKYRSNGIDNGSSNNDVDTRSNNDNS